MIFRPVEVWLTKLPHATWGALTVPSTYLSLDLLLRLYWPCRHAQPITQSFLSISPEGRWRIRVKTTDSKFDIIARSILHLQQLAKIFKVYKMPTEALLVLTWKLYVFIEGTKKNWNYPLLFARLLRYRIDVDFGRLETKKTYGKLSAACFIFFSQIWLKP